jgi:hypothetical protein
MPTESCDDKSFDDYIDEFLDEWVSDDELVERVDLTQDCGADSTGR